MRPFDPRVQLPTWVTRYFPDAVWRIPEAGKKLFLTFDDGPIPELTPWILDFLDREQITACFFCVGDNVRKYPQWYHQIIEAGHLTGNHTFNHVQGLKLGAEAYFQNVEKARELIHSRLFRPPHGWMTKAQYELVKANYQVIMWDVVSCDYRQTIRPSGVVKNVCRFARDGSLITFHDSLKSEQNIYKALPEVVGRMKAEGYEFTDLRDFLPNFEF